MAHIAQLCFGSTKKRLSKGTGVNYPIQVKTFKLFSKGVLLQLGHLTRYIYSPVRVSAFIIDEMFLRVLVDCLHSFLIYSTVEV